MGRIVVIETNGLLYRELSVTSSSSSSTRQQKRIRVSRNTHEILRIAVATMLDVDSTEYAMQSRAEAVVVSVGAVPPANDHAVPYDKVLLPVLSCFTKMTPG